MLIIDKGNDVDVHSAILISKNKFAGYGTFTPDIQNNPTEILEQIEYKEDNPDSRHIISSYLKSKKIIKLIDL